MAVKRSPTKREENILLVPKKNAIAFAPTEMINSGMMNGFSSVVIVFMSIFIFFDVSHFLLF
jgi:hypothetical protein